METLQAPRLIKNLPLITILLVVAYILLFILFGSKLGPPVLSLSVVPVLLVGWTFGFRAGLLAGLLSFPLSTLLFNFIGFSGWDVVFREGGGPESFLLVLVGGMAGSAHDLTGRLAYHLEAYRSAQKALRANEEDHLALFEGVPIGIYRSRPDGQILAANSALVELLGYPDKDALLAKNALEIFQKSGDRVFGQELLETNGVIRHFEVQLQRLDGSIIWVEDNARMVPDEEGRCRYYEGSLIDIDKRKRAEEALKESEARYRDLLDHIPQKVFYKNSDLVYIKCNPSYVSDFNLSLDEIVGKTDYDLFPLELAEKYRRDDRQVIDTGLSVELDEDFIRNGVTRAIHTVKVPVRDPQGSVAGILGIFWDITERKRIEEARERLLADQVEIRQRLQEELAERERIETDLRESEQRYLGLFKDSPVSLWEEDFSEVKRYIDDLRSKEITDLSEYMDEHPEVVANCLSRVRIMDVNQETLTLYEASDKAELLENVDKIFSPQSYPIIRDELLAISQGRRVFNGEGRNRTLGGNDIDIYLRWSVAPGCEDSLSRVFVSILDITGRKKAEEQVQKQILQAEALTGVANALSASSLDADSIYAIIATQTASLIGDACLLTLISENQEWVELVAFHHANANRISLMREIFPSGPLPLGDGSISQALKTGKPLIIPAFRKEAIDQVKEPIFPIYLDRFEVDSLLILPLTAQGHVIGTLGVLRDHPGAQYTLEDLSLLRYLSNQAALPILNARLHELIKQQAHTDPLTGVPNRRYFFDLADMELQRAQRTGQNLAAIMLDVDNFKYINDTYGHEAGDQMLQLVAQQCRATARSTDLVGRYGGDEFLIMLLDTDKVGAALMAERLRKAMEACPLVLEGDLIHVTISLGIANRTPASSNLTRLLHLADEAMYVAKREGGNRVRASELGLDQ